ncbi:MAG: DUF4445 domain-containing protein [wastewater metagenome]|nr:DUF4445 domain-containing protein [Candidatus Loosdrechtia aerotolerans]
MIAQYAKIIFYPLKIEGVVPKGITILGAARRLGITMEGPCSGTGKCGKDLVQIRINRTLNTVLACKTIIETDIEVFIPYNEKRILKIIEGFYTQDKKKYTVNPSIKKVFNKHHNLSSTGVYSNDKLLSFEEGDTRSQTYGIALDIGTTTLVASLVDLTTGKIMGNSSTLNPLVYYGHDVMSRIKYSSSHENGLMRMHKELISAINLLTNTLSTENGIKAENVYQVIAAGNTTMQHILLNKEIREIGEYPYRAEILDTFSTTAKELAIDIPSYAPITVLPCISAYVGGDIVAGLLAIEPKTGEVPTLFLDIGTNGELVLLLHDRIVATSTAAGPCFEGMTISSGMRACEGAIEHVSAGEEGLSMEVIGNGPPRGICGSGLLDIVSELIRIGFINSRGRLQNRNGEKSLVHYQNHLFEKDGKRYFSLASDTSISQEDIRQVQLAKAAIRAGVEVLLTTCNIRADDLKTVVIAGAFGYHLNKESLFRIGLLPRLAGVDFSFIGNSSLEGAVRILLDKELLNRAALIANTAQVTELSQVPEFESIYIREMHF